MELDVLGLQHRIARTCTRRAARARTGDDGQAADQSITPPAAKPRASVYGAEVMEADDPERPEDLLACVPVELDRHQTQLGELILRRRKLRGMGYALAYEVLLDDEFLMSSVVNASEVALARLGLAGWGDEPCRVLVGGLGLGCTADAALSATQVRALDVLELLAPVLAWHTTALVPMGARLTGDPRCRLLHGDFFEWARGGASPAAPDYDVVLLDIDHSSEFLLQPAHASLYSVEGLRSVAARLTARGVFAFWSSDHAESGLASHLEQVFPAVEVHEVEFPNPALAEPEVNSIVVARKHREISK